MKKLLGIGFWELIARIILRSRIVIIGCIVLITVLLAFQWKYIRFTQTEANLIPADDKVNVDYNKFLHQFGEEGNMIVIATKDQKLFTPKVYQAWSDLMNEIKSHKEVTLVVSVDNLQKHHCRQSDQQKHYSGKRQTPPVTQFADQAGFVKLFHVESQFFIIPNIFKGKILHV